MDRIRSKGGVKMLNFAGIRADFQKPLGAGSFSKVYQGSYRGKECAIKLIYTIDLTADVIKRVAAEASILSAIRHSNVVNIYGVSVLPPSVCILLELCSFGSLSDILHGGGAAKDSSRPALVLSQRDLLWLALGCARGLAAVHEYDEFICHRDIKSFNFLVDHQLNAKIADLELGIQETFGLKTRKNKNDFSANAHSGAGSGSGSGSGYGFSEVTVDEMLANWMAPEVVSSGISQQTSDIYALGVVFWELLTRELPFDELEQPQIRRKLLEGYSLPLPADEVHNPITAIVNKCWAANPKNRPRATAIVAELETAIAHIEDKVFANIKYIPKFNILSQYYEAVYGADEESAAPRRSDWKSLWQRNDAATGGADSSSACYSLEPTVSMPLPSAAIDSIRQVKEEPFWNKLEKSGEAWMVVTPMAPFVVLHVTSSWFDIFDVMIPSQQQSSQQILSLTGLMTLPIHALPNHTACSNGYVSAATSQNQFKEMRAKAAKEVVAGLQTGREYHGLLPLHLYTKFRALEDHYTGPSSQALQFHSLSAEASEGPRAYNTMFSLHAYPVFTENQINTMKASSASIPETADNASTSTLSTAAAVSSLSSLSSMQSSNRGVKKDDKATTAAKPILLSEMKPIYIAICLHELRSAYANENSTTIPSRLFSEEFADDLDVNNKRANHDDDDEDDEIGDASAAANRSPFILSSLLSKYWTFDKARASKREAGASSSSSRTFSN